MRELNFLRAIAAFLVIAIHIVSGRVTISKFAFAWDVAMICAVPIFIILSGYLLHYTYQDNRQLNYLEFLKKRLSKVLIPYLIWTIIYMIYSLNGNYIKIFSLGFFYDLLKNLITGRGFIHLYFMVIIIQLYIIFPLLRNLYNKHSKLTWIVSFVLSLYFNMEPYFRQRNIYILPAAGVPYYSDFFAKWIFYFVLGMYFADNSQKLIALVTSKKAELTIVWTSLCISVVMLSRALGMSSPILNPITIVYDISCFLLLYAVCFCFREKFSRFTVFMEWFSKQSFIIYLSHLILIKLTLLKITSIFGVHIWYGTFGLILLLLASVAVTCIFTYIVSLTPLAALLGGVRKVKKTEKVLAPY